MGTSTPQLLTSTMVSHCARTVPLSSWMRAILAVTLCLAVTHATAAVISHTRSETRFGPGALGSLEMPTFFDPTTGSLDGVTLQIDPISQVNATSIGMNVGD